MNLEFKKAPQIENQEKLAEWNQTLFEVNRTVDGAGKLIDPKIKETVVAFMVNGFETDSSCEGHLDSGRLYPWIGINSILNTPEFTQEAKIFEDKMKTSGYENPWLLEKTKDPDLYRRFQELNGESVAYKKDLEIKIKSVLNDFYSKHISISDEAKLCVWEGPESFDVAAMGGAGIGKSSHELFKEKEKNMTLEEKKKFLENAQSEMNAFTEYLKEKFFNYK